MDNNSLYLNLTQQLILQRQMEITANNVANVNTNGFRQIQSLFSQYLVNNKKQTISYPIDKATIISNQNSGLTFTGSFLDLAIIGQGFFKIQSNGKIAYTRNGNFTIDNNGNIVTQDGDLLLDIDDQEINIEENAEISIDKNGNISQILDGESDVIGQIGIFTFAKPHMLQAYGNNLYISNQDSILDTQATVKQRMLEMSNVQSVYELNNMINITRRYESGMNRISSYEKLNSETLSRLGTIKL